MAVDMKKFLAQGAQNWDSTVEAASKNTFENPPDGTYIMQLTTAELTESGNGDPMIKWSYTILEGDCAGQIKWDWTKLNGTRGLEPLAWRLRDFGIDITKVNIRKLEEILAELVVKKLVLRGQLKTKKVGDNEFQNLKVVRMLPNYNGPDESNSDSIRVGSIIRWEFPSGDGNTTSGEGPVTKIINANEVEVEFDGGLMSLPIEYITELVS